MVEDSQADLLTEASKKSELLRNICEGHEGPIVSEEQLEALCLSHENNENNLLKILHLEIRYQKTDIMHLKDLRI